MSRQLSHPALRAACRKLTIVLWWLAMVFLLISFWSWPLGASEEFTWAAFLTAFAFLLTGIFLAMFAFEKE